MMKRFISQLFVVDCMSLAKKLVIAGIGLVSIIGLSGCSGESKADSKDKTPKYKEASIGLRDIEYFKGNINGERIEYDGRRSQLMIRKTDGTLVVFYDAGDDGLAHPDSFNSYRDFLEITKNENSRSYRIEDMSPKEFNDVLDKFESYLRAIQNEVKKERQSLFNSAINQ